MWIEIQTPVIAVAEVEMAVEHQDLELLQILQRLFADLVFPVHETSQADLKVRLYGGSGHKEILVSALTKSGLPPTSVAATPPHSSHPSKGVFFDRDRSVAASIFSIKSGAMMVMSAGAPSESVPPGTFRMRAGLTDSSSTTRDKRIRPACTRRSSESGTAVSRPMMPKGARSYSTFFSS